MSRAIKNNITRSMHLGIVLSVLISYPVFAATVELNEGVDDSGFILDNDFSSFEGLQSAQKQAMERVKNNYLFVIALVKKKQYEEANSKVSVLVKDSPNQSIYYNLQALLQLVDKDLEGAEKSFLKAVELNSKNGQALTGLAKLALEKKQLERAKDYANKVLLINPRAIKAYQILADVALLQQGIDAAEVVLLEAHSKVKNDFNLELAILQPLGKVYISKKQPEKLLQLATDFVARNKDNPLALSFFAEAQLINQDDFGAEKTLRQIVAQQPDDAKHLFLLARLLGKQEGKETEILSLLDKAVFNQENPVLVLSYKTAVLLKQKNYKQAFAVAQQVEKLNPTQSIGKVLKADVFAAEKKYQHALKNYQLAYVIMPNIKVLDAMLRILALQNKPKDAVALIKKEQLKDKDNIALQYRLAVAYQNTQQFDLSKKHYEAILLKQQDNVIVLNNLAWVYNQQNNPKAEILAEKANKLAPKSGAVADTYGYILLKNGKVKKSLNVLKKAAELKPDLNEIQLHLAEAYIANQQKARAKEILQHLLNSDSDEKEIAKELMKSL